MTNRKLVAMLLAFCFPVKAQEHKQATQAPGTAPKSDAAKEDGSDEEDAPPPVETPLTREMDGHVFIPSELVLDPFNDSFMGTATGVGYATIRGMDTNLTALSQTSHPLAAIAEGARLQLGLADWWSVRAQGSVLLLAPTTNDSALANRPTEQFLVGGGTTMSGKIGDSFRLGLAFDADWGQTYQLDLLGTIERSLQAGAVDATNYVQRARRTTLAGTVVGAVTLNPAMGFVFNVQYLRAYAQMGDVQAAANAIAAAALLDFDFRAAGAAPVGFTAGYRIIAPLGMAAPAIEHDFTTGLYYTGQPYLVFGAETQLRWMHPGPGQDGFSVLPQLVVRTYW